MYIGFDICHNTRRVVGGCAYISAVIDCTAQVEKSLAGSAGTGSQDRLPVKDR